MRIRPIYRAILAFCLASSATLSAQQVPEVQDGFKADAVYDFKGVDNINLFNGNITATIPLGHSYPVSQNLSYGFTLTYNGNPWEFLKRCVNTPSGGLACIDQTLGEPYVAIPSQRSNVALGWSIRMGELLHPNDPRNAGNGPEYIFISPDGAEHTLYATLEYCTTNPGPNHCPIENDPGHNYYYSRDNSYVRLIAPSSTGSGAQYTVEMPNGTEYLFQQETPTFSSIKLSKVTDQYSGNEITVSYSNYQDGVPLTWTVRDSHNRTHFVEFADAQPNGGLQWVNRPYYTKLDQVRLDAFGGGTATYDAAINNVVSIDRPFPHGEPYNGSANPCFAGPIMCQVEVPLLTKVTFPAGGETYEMSYFTQNSGTGAMVDKLPGSLDEMILPTQGVIDWEYQSYMFPNNQMEDLASEPPGVQLRTLRDRYGSVLKETSYATVVGDGTPGIPNDQKQYMKTTVTDTHAPDNSIVEERAYIDVDVNGVIQSELITEEKIVTEHFFSAMLYDGEAQCTNSGMACGWSKYNWGLPFSAQYSETFDGMEMYLSKKTYKEVNGNSSLLRSIYVAYDYDHKPPGAHPDPNPNNTPGTMWSINRREAGNATYYWDDEVSGGHRHAWLTRDDYNRYGGWGEVRTGGNFDPGTDEEKTTITNYDSNTLPAYESARFRNPWVIGLPTDSLTKNQSEGEKQEFCYDTSTGSLLRARTLASDAVNPSRSTVDFIQDYDYDSDGNRDREVFYGGELKPLSSVGGSLCSMNLSGTYHKFAIDSTFQYGSLKQSGYESMPHLNQSFEIDQSTGLPSWQYLFDGSSTNTGRLGYQFVYDQRGRVTNILSPAGHGAKTTYSYVEAINEGGVSTPAKVIKQEKLGGILYSKFLWIYDDAGRLFRERKFQGSGADEKHYRETTYNGFGNVLKKSVWGEFNKGFRYLKYDPFGRVGKIRPPEGDHNKISFEYKGDKQVTRTVPMGVSGSSGNTTLSPVEFEEFYDRYGRLILQEQLGLVDHTTSDVEENIRTSYGYDIGDRLTYVKQRSQSSSSIKQERFFDYDGRGLLISEDHPETGTIGYGLFDALGNAEWVTVTDSLCSGSGCDPFTLRYAHDRAGRVYKIRDNGSGGRVHKEFVYGSSNVGANRSMGQLTKATRHNHIAFPWESGVENDRQVIEEYEYEGKGGRVSSKSTKFLDVDTAFEVNFDQGWTWTQIGQVDSMSYPRCVSSVCSGVAAAPETMDQQYNNFGYLTRVNMPINQVQTDWVTLSYLPTDHPKTVTHSNGAIDDYFLNHDQSGERLSKIRITRGSSVVDLGPFDYDAAGNMISMEGCSSQLGDPMFDPSSSFLATQETYRYDKSGRLVYGRDCGNETFNYHYDQFNNLTRLKAPSTGNGTQTLPVDKTTNRLSGWSYDSQGNQTSLGVSPVNTYKFDHLGRMAYRTANNKQFYFYTASDERFLTMDRDETAAVGDENHWTWRIRGLGGELLTEYKTEGHPSTASAWEWKGDWLQAGGPLAQRLVVGESGGQPIYGTHHFHKDRMGSVRVTTGPPQGNVPTDINGNYFEPFGQEFGSYTGPNESLLRFTGHERDLNLDRSGSTNDGHLLDYMHARYYAPLNSRFLSVDPVLGSPEVPMSWNRYAYVQNNPMNRVDPTGKKEKEPTKAQQEDIEEIDGSETPIDEGRARRLDLPPNDQNREAYNCHSYCFSDGQGDPGGRGNSPTLPGWDNTPADNLGTFKQLSGDEANQVGDVVIYINADGEMSHSARVYQVDAQGNTVSIIGKLGENAIAIHHPAQREIEAGYGTTRQYYRQKSKAQARSVKRRSRRFNKKRSPTRTPPVLPPQ